MYMQRTTSGAAGNGLYTTIKCMRGASGIGMGTKICDEHCEYNDAQPERFSHGQRGRDVSYADTIINAHHVR